MLATHGEKQGDDLFFSFRGFAHVADLAENSSNEYRDLGSGKGVMFVVKGFERICPKDLYTYCASFGASNFQE